MVRYVQRACDPGIRAFWESLYGYDRTDEALETEVAKVRDHVTALLAQLALD